MKGLGADERYWQALSEGRLELPRCASCGHWHWPAPFRCSACGGWDFEWIPTEMAGAIYSWTRTWHPFDGAESLGSPFVSVAVELPQAGGIRLLGILEEDAAPTIGRRVAGRVGSSHVYGRDIPALRWKIAA